MHLLLPLFIASSLLSSISTLTTSYQYVKFLKQSDQLPERTSFHQTTQIHPSGQPKSSGLHLGVNPQPTGARKQRSFYYQYPLTSFVDNLHDFLPDVVFLPPQTGHLNHLYEPEITLHSDFRDSNSIGHYDPYLLPAPQAKSIASYWYRKGLFFSDIAHADALLKLQERRLENGLAENRFGSLNDLSPFSRAGHGHGF